MYIHIYIKIYYYEYSCISIDLNHVYASSAGRSSCGISPTAYGA